MKTVFFIIATVILICIILFNSYINSSKLSLIIENFTADANASGNANVNGNANSNTDIRKSSSSLHSILLMGDSILKNNSYVKYGYAVEDILRLNTDIRFYMFAKENAKISDVYNQLQELEYIDIAVYNNFFDISNDGTTLLFLSVGGNDILEYYKLNGVITSNEINTIFNKYKLLITAIRNKLPYIRIKLINLYHVNNDKYRDINQSIDLWNTLLNEYASDSNNKVDGIMDLTHLITAPDDLRQIIEPSEVGGKKIANKIVEYL